MIDGITTRHRDQSLSVSAGLHAVATVADRWLPRPCVQVFACTVGQKPSKAPYYVNDPEDVLFTLARLGEASALQNGGTPPVLSRVTGARIPSAGGSAAGSAPPSPPALRGVL